MMLKWHDVLELDGSSLTKNGTEIALITRCYDAESAYYTLWIPSYLPDFFGYAEAGPFQTKIEAQYFAETMAEQIDLNKHIKQRTLRDILNHIKPPTLQ